MALSQVPPPAQALRLDPRSLTAAGLCALALFFDWFGWVFAIAGIVLLRRAVFSRGVKWLLGAVAIGPKLLFIGVRSLNAPEGLSFPFEPRNLATSPSLWAWCVLLAAFGAFFLILPRRTSQGPNAPVEPGPRRSLAWNALGLAPIGIAAALLLGLTDGFHWIEDAGQGRWALKHAARGNVAVFAASELASIEGTEWKTSRSGSRYTVRVGLADGRSYSVTAASAAVLDEMRKFATTADLPAGKARIVRRNGYRWVNGTSGFALKDCVGTYTAPEEGGQPQSTYEFWLEGGRLAGKETVAGAAGRHVRTLRNIKLNDNGEMEFEPAAYVEASQKETGGSVSFSLRWSPTGETGRFAGGGLEIGTRKYRKQ